MRLRGLTQPEIEKFANLDWDDSTDKENEEDDIKSVQLVSNNVDRNP